LLIASIDRAIDRYDQPCDGRAVEAIEAVPCDMHFVSMPPGVDVNLES
jgi:hypothetical protein